MEMLDKIESPTEYINTISKLLPYSIGKVKSYDEIEEREPYQKYLISLLCINIFS